MMCSVSGCLRCQRDRDTFRQHPAADATKPAGSRQLTYAVEASSAGEEVALANGCQRCIRRDSQAKALMEVQVGTADAANTLPSWPAPWWAKAPAIPDLTVTDQKSRRSCMPALCRKGSDLASFHQQRPWLTLCADGVLEATGLSIPYALRPPWRIVRIRAHRFQLT